MAVTTGLYHSGESSNEGAPLRQVEIATFQDLILMVPKEENMTTNHTNQTLDNRAFSHSQEAKQMSSSMF